MLLIHFLNVGNGDCSIISHQSKRLSMVDINNGKELDQQSFDEIAAHYQLEPYERIYSRLIGLSKYEILQRKGYDIEITNPIEFLKKHYPNRPIFRYIQTHPDLDHMRGLVGLRKENIKVFNFWDTEHNKVPDFESNSDEEEWGEYEKFRAEKFRTKILYCYRGYDGIYYNQDPEGIPPGDGWEILSPTPDIVKVAVEAKNWNNLSYVLRLAFMGIKIIFAGDAEEEVWNDLVKEYGNELKCHILKASHHGRETGYHEEAIKRMSPEYTIVSVGKKPENDASNKYRKYCDNVWSTRWKGNITFTIFDDGRELIIPQYDRKEAQ
jgi:competence protein ComEC